MIDFLLHGYRLKDEIRSGWELRGVSLPESVADHSWGTALLCMLYAPAEGIDVDRTVRMSLVHDIAEAELGDVPRRVRPEDRPMTHEEKQRREREAFHRLVAMFPGEVQGRLALRSLWEEYEAGETAEAQFVRDMNLIDMCLQALYYEQAQRYPGGEASGASRRERAAGTHHTASAGRPSGRKGSRERPDEPERGAPPEEPPNAAGFAGLDEFFETARPRIGTKIGGDLFAEIEARYRSLREENP